MPQLLMHGQRWPHMIKEGWREVTNRGGWGWLQVQQLKQRRGWPRLIGEGWKEVKKRQTKMVEMATANQRRTREVGTPNDNRKRPNKSQEGR